MVCIARYSLLAVCIAYIAPVTDSADIQKIVTDIGKGTLNDEVGILLRDMQQHSEVDISKTTQYILATPLNIDSDNKLTIGSKVGYYKNEKKNAVFDGRIDDCDKQCRESIRKVKTQSCRTCTPNKRVQIHTELLFVYGKRFRAELQQKNIFLIYSTYIPCCGLAGYSYGECAADMASYLFDRRDQPNRVYFVFISSGCFEITNSRLSMLYQSLAGIPLLQCENIQNDNPIACQVTNSPLVSDITQYVAKPVYQRFPRIHTLPTGKKTTTFSYETYNKANIFCDCLAQGRFLQSHYNSENVGAVEGDPLTDLMLSRFVVELYMSIYNGNVRNYGHDMVRMTPGLQLSANTLVIEQRCELFMKCLPNEITDGALKPNEKIDIKDFDGILDKYNLLKGLERNICRSSFGRRFDQMVRKSNLCKDHQDIIIG